MKRVLIALLSAALAAGVMLQAPERVIAAVNDIYVGGNDDTTAASSCADPDFSTDLTDEGDINSALDAALAAVTTTGIGSSSAMGITLLLTISPSMMVIQLVLMG